MFIIDVPVVFVTSEALNPFFCNDEYTEEVTLICKNVKTECSFEFFL